MDQLTTEITLRDGRKATVRPLDAGDVAPLTELFLSLSDDTKSRYGPHPFDAETAAKLCATIDHSKAVRFVTVLDRPGQGPQFVGYMILSRELWAGDRERYAKRISLDDVCSLAPCVADAFQDQGVGSRMARHVVDSARVLGFKHMILTGGVLDWNARARHFYKKLGFYEVGDFYTHNAQGDILNHDMILDL